MSYILDALKRAESERSRGAVPNLHAQPGLAGDGDAGGSVVWQRAALGGAVAALLAAAVAWWWMSGELAPPPVAAAGATPSKPKPTPTPAPVAQLPASPVVPVLTAPAKPNALPRVAQKAAPLPVSPPAREPTSATAAASAPERIYTQQELPDHIRSSLPVLTVGGATYSDNAASRMLIVNGNLFHEGDQLTPELTLQQIKLRAAVLSFRGYRYSISY